MLFLQRAFDLITRRFWAVALVFFLNGLCLVILFGIEGQFKALTEMPVFDTQNDLTRDKILTQIPLYEGEARNIYWAFAAFDFVFPLVGGIFFTLLYGYFLRRFPWGWADQLWRGRFYVLPLLTTAFDYLENVGFIATLLGGTPPSETAMQMALTFKQLKLFSLNANNVLSGVLLIVFIVAALQVRGLPKPVNGH